MSSIVTPIALLDAGPFLFFHPGAAGYYKNVVRLATAKKAFVGQFSSGQECMQRISSLGKQDLSPGPFPTHAIHGLIVPANPSKR